MVRPALPVARPEAARGRITFDRVSFAYDGSTPVVRDVSFEVLPGEHVGIVGATGSGKSTLVNLLLRFYDVTDGRILVDGIDVREMEPKELRSIFGLVLQDVHIFSRSVSDNIRFGNERLSDAAVRQAAEGVCAAGIIKRLSGGFDRPACRAWRDAFSGREGSFSRSRGPLPRTRPCWCWTRRRRTWTPATERLIEEAIQRLMAGRTDEANCPSPVNNPQNGQDPRDAQGKNQGAGTHEELLRKGGIYSAVQASGRGRHRQPRSFGPWPHLVARGSAASLKRRSRAPRPAVGRQRD